MINVYVPQGHPLARPLPFLGAPPERDNKLFQAIPLAAYAGIITRVPLEDASYVLFPHDLALVPKDGYLERVLEEAGKAGKRTLIFVGNDDTKSLPLPNTIVFRPSAYRSTLLPHEVVIPAFVEDLGALHGSSPLSKGEHATVGFMGKAGFASLGDGVRYILRNYLLTERYEREGMYFRRRALASLKKSSVVLDATVRRTFSANRKSIEVPPEEARRAYVASLKRNLCTLSPRGDGNYSLRFYETLSMGRIPILIDTDMRLPLEESIDYDEFILRIPWQEVDRTGDRVASFFASHDEAALYGMQQKARAAFETFLYMPRYLEAVLTRPFLDKVR